MRNVILTFAVLLTLTLAACGDAASSPTATTAPVSPMPTLQPTPNVQATVDTAVNATQQAQPTLTPLPVATPTTVPVVAMKPAATTAPAMTPLLVATAIPATAPAAPSAATLPMAPAEPVTMELLDVITFPSSSGGVVIQGIVINKGIAEAGFAEVVVSLIDKGGQTVGTGREFSRPSLLMPAEKGFFSVSIRDSDKKGVDVAVQVQARPADSETRAATYKDFKVDGVNASPRSSPTAPLKIRGQVTNTGQKVANITLLTIGIYAPDGKLVYVDTTVATLNDIGPGQSSPFEFALATTRDLPVPIERYDIVVSGTPES